MIRKNVEAILEGLPQNVELVAAAKTRTTSEIEEAIEGGVGIIGENYVQEAAGAFRDIGHKVKWHFIGHLQKNKVKKAIEIFDVIETVDSLKLAEAINRKCAALGKTMSVFIEINSGKESQKSGVYPEDAIKLVKKIALLSNIKVRGLMTMGPLSGDPENARPYFSNTKELFDKIKKEEIAGVTMDYLSMGMTNSYKVAIDEGANIVRIGTKIFGDRG
ncbi:MAG: YggS family pyridoxal phosphate-dependent enzyme [Candidatus Aadella gelida]|nr:YggS family pyridoxal phosphate-dependent enzyme [Candidatus Aadella gelida]